ncbi:MAG: ABC transporter ATP-binding protein [Actinobacteria bacterium]|nr:MAG: ABC transporter ATP-binding protein [Actinomycetota bacterium]
MSSPAIEIQAIGKKFRRYRERPTSLKQRLTKFRVRSEEFWALKDVGIEIHEGSTFGLIGPNGSGKTTLLKIVAGILRPTEGKVTTRGRIAALLELGAGFHPELTGRENVYLNGSILGLSRREIDQKFDAIVEFAELEDFIDNQVKFYSSGMFVRLGFAVAVHVDPQILLIDEVLAVGDEGFQRKCLDRIRQFQREGRTIMFVTHAADLVRQICDEAVMLDHGAIVSAGNPEEVVRHFRLHLLKEDLAYAKDEGTKEIEIVSASLIREDGGDGQKVTSGQTLTIQIDLKATNPIDDPVISFALHDQDNRFIYGTNTDWMGLHFHPFEGKRRLRFHLRNLPFVRGKFWVTLGVHSKDASVVYHVQEQRYSFEVEHGAENPGEVFIPVEVEVEEL